ncbi:DUF4389 domain-containing protein [Arthrobacter sp.]|uniref:DUF4389 domain-containing protein n=1 Tax=Arthrobacter sp. TaxID=1667 RepID=UPI00258785B9|nr:DUF4389 domain-containing protein [Arthrobacter sp.]
MERQFPYPLVLDGDYSPHLNRRLWLVKWLLVIPHVIVLFFLWIAFLGLSVAAFFTILVTGRCPRAIFDFNVGVLRWTWRVGYYSYSALGTDQYPPFTLADDPNYPARLSIERPQSLSRGLVLVKWRLLALPHYLIIGVFTGAAFAGYDQVRNHNAWAYGSGLIRLLVCIAALVLLFAGRYPRGVFDLVVGLNRWVFRVSAYAALMTDQYPPLRLDMGGHETHTADAPITIGPDPLPAG